jgi:nitrogen regulatory protein P-II 1
MKEVKAFIHRGRVVDVIHALEEAGFRYLSVSDVKGLLTRSVRRNRSIRWSLASG